MPAIHEPPWKVHRCTVTARYRISVAGMTCEACEQHVIGALRAAGRARPRPTSTAVRPPPPRRKGWKRANSLT
jgi:hypothetical protein